MRVWDRSKLQEWKQISRQDDFKQTLQNIHVSTMCTSARGSPGSGHHGAHRLNADNISKSELKLQQVRPGTLASPPCVELV